MEESEPEVLKIEESESELLCTDSTALVQSAKFWIVKADSIIQSVTIVL
jgi:hypothetical protein